jgi:hypothetical protein
VLERLSRHGPASEGDWRHLKPRPAWALVRAAPATFPAPTIHWSNWEHELADLHGRWMQKYQPLGPGSLQPTPNCSSNMVSPKNATTENWTLSESSGGKNR